MTTPASSSITNFETTSTGYTIGDPIILFVCVMLATVLLVSQIGIVASLL